MKIKAGICGFVVGDALGVPAEFSSRETLQKNPVKQVMEHTICHPELIQMILQ